MKTKHLLAAAILTAAIAHTPAMAQLASGGGGDPLAKATTGAATFRDSLAQFGLVVGGIGMVSCLLLGFFGKLNWKWVSTGIGVSFAIVAVPGLINWVSSLAA